ncbi:NERD domain-containing protein [Sediminibacillus dalangtanensis]|uniref:NERD domain-containing protein n=1 Tax=Sediminibacillus dalangtanensis TaxID=2729421 RepID=A0ABX7VXM8_9BACI|nr:nuclease-related domain-containing protein [Sediminibacillus dalangtanensis]QTN00795.1 NERD domain-containing protein [Sediminibacillus dalangtanensis]
MIVKKRAVPHKLQVLEALIRRLPASHSKFPSIKEDYTRRLAGYHGEKQIDFHLTSLPPDSFSIFHDLRLPYKQHYFQMDSLLLSKKFAVILEIKNVTGTLLFDQTFNQLIRTADEKEEGFQSPLVQVENQKRKLLEYFSQHTLPILPIESFIVVSNPRTIIKANGNKEDISRKVIHSEFLTERLNEVKSHYANSPSYSLEKMRMPLLGSHTEDQVNAYTLKGMEIGDPDRGPMP